MSDEQRAGSSLMLMKGGRRVEMEELEACVTPPPEGVWHPVAHSKVLSLVTETLRGAGYRVRSQQLGLSHGSDRFFGVLDLDSPLAEGVGLSVGLRNSVDKSFPLGFAAGSRVMVCDNLAFRSELLVKKKHTTHGMKHFGGAIANAVSSLASFQEDEKKRIEWMQNEAVSTERASHIILQAYRRGIISTLLLPGVCKEWEEPTHEEFKPRTVWSLFNAFTETLRPKVVANPQAFVASTIRLNGLILPEDKAPERPSGEVEVD
jgi:hypothetical protein